MLGITFGDPAGIGPEVVIKALAKIKPKIAVVLFGDEAVLERLGQPLPAGAVLVSTGAITNRCFPVGKPTRETGAAALSYLQKAVAYLKEGRINSLVTAPVSKEAISQSGFPFRGHTEYLAESFKVKDYGMLFAAGRFRLLLLTTHLPLQEVTASLSVDLIVRKVRLAWHFLHQRFHIQDPSILICGVNPHAGEGGTLGTEETRVFLPALAELRRQGITISGPVAADTAYRIYRQESHDLLVSAYHDQILPLFKALYFQQAVNITIGLPFLRTSPDHGTAFGLAYQNKADSGSMAAAIRLALKM